MKIITLENENRRLDLSKHERKILVQVATYLQDYYDDLEFDIRRFTTDQAQSARSILESNKDQDYLILSKKQTELIDKVFSEAENFMSDLIYDSKIDQEEDFETIPGELFDVLFDNLRTREEIDEFKKKINS